MTKNKDQSVQCAYAYQYNQKGLLLDVSRYIHALMQNTGDINGIIADPINDDVPAGWKEAVRGRKFGPDMADLGILLNGQKRLIENSPIGISLRLAPGVEGVLQDVGKVFLSLRREN